MLGCFLSFRALSEEGPAEAQTTDFSELSLEALMEVEVPKVYGASKIEQTTSEAPASITIVPQEEIKRYGHRTLADVLRSVQGLNVSYDRNYAFLGTRGVSLGDFNSRTLLLVNGHRVNNNLTDGAFIDTAFILDVDLIDRVEVIRGPSAVMYGNNAFSGVINVITRTGKQLNGLEATGEYGSYDTYKGRVTYGRSFTNGFQFLISGTYYDSDGDDRLFYEEFDTPAQNNGVAENMDSDTFKSVFGSLSYKDFTLEGGYVNREKVNPTAIFAPFTAFNDPRLRTEDERSYVNLKYAHNFEDVVDVSARVYYDRNDSEIGFPEASSGRLFKDESFGEWWGAEVQLDKRVWDRHVLTLGAEYRDDFTQEQQGFYQDEGPTTPVNSRDRQSHAVFVQGDFMIYTNLHFNGGVRYDHYSDFDPRFNPRLALIYNPWEKATFKGIYGTAFRTPNFSELNDTRFQDIDPEEITAYEMIYEQGIGKHLSASITGFINQMDDLIAFENGAFTNFNAQTKGIELALQGIWENGIRTRLSYSFQHTENEESDADFPDSPAHLGKINVSVPIFRDKIFASLEYQYVSSRETLFTSPTGETLQGVDVDGYGVVNFTLFSQNLVKNLEFSASVYNVLDKTYSDPSSRFHTQDDIEQNGRSFRVKLCYKF